MSTKSILFAILNRLKPAFPAEGKDPLTRVEVANLLEKFLDGTGGRWDYDDFTQGMTSKDPLILHIQSETALISKNYPPEKRGLCNQQGVKVLRGFVTQLRSSGPGEIADKSAV